MSWSSGKDSTYALGVVGVDPTVSVVGLLVTMNASADRVAMHAVRRQLVEAQADRLDLPLHWVELPAACTNEVYESRMDDAMDAAAAEGVGAVVFGDLFLEDVRAYRERTLIGRSVQPLFPLWKRPTDELAHEMVAAGIEAVVTCVDPSTLPASFAGRPFDEAFLDDLPAGVDPCGERGEFHTFVWNSPEFASPIDIRTGNIVTRDGFVFCDIEVADRSVPERRVHDREDILRPDVG